MIVGSAEILVRAVTTGFDKEVKDSTAPAFAGLRKDAETAGVDAGAGLRSGVRKESGKLAGDLKADGAKAGEGLHSGISSGLSKVASALSATGLPVGALTTGLEKSAKAAEDTGGKAGGLADKLNHLGGVALLGVAGGAAIAAAGAAHLGEEMQSADTKIAAASGTSVAAATKVGDAFLNTGGKAEYSGEQMANAFAGVAGQLKTTEGHALSAAQANQVMAASSDLATAKQEDLGQTTGVVASVMQAFQLKAADAGHVTDVLYTASTATGQSIDSLGNSVERIRSKLGDTAGSLSQVAGLLLDMTEHGITGRAAMSGLNSGMNALSKTSTAVVTAQQNQDQAFAQMPPALQKVAKAYESGAMSSADFHKVIKALPPDLANLANKFVTSSSAVQTAKDKYSSLGITVFNSRGQFVGMGSIIDQLAPKFARMTQQQQLATATTLFGAGAARQMTAIINAGPAAYDRATQAVSRHGAAQSAAAKQASSLHGEEHILSAEIVDEGTKIGQVLIPALTAMVGAILKATTFVTQHKEVLIALAAVVVGVLGTAIAVFTVNKMAAFGKSFVDASGHVKKFAGDVQTGVEKVMGLFGKQSVAADDMATKVQTATTKASSAVDEEATNVTTATGTIETDNATAGSSFTTVATDAEAAQVKVAASETTMVGEVTAADTTIETENTAAASSFAGIGAGLGLGALGVAAGGLAGMGDQLTGAQATYNFMLANGTSKQQALATIRKTHPGFTPAAAGAGPSIVGSAIAGAPNSPATQEKMLQAMGLSAAGAAGLVGNFAQESSNNPNMNIGAAGMGLASWTTARANQLRAYAAANNESPTSLSAQIGFVMQELQGMPALLNMLKTTNNPTAAALAVQNQYERPAAGPTANTPHRVAAALQAFTNANDIASPTASAGRGGGANAAVQNAINSALPGGGSGTAAAGSAAALRAAAVVPPGARMSFDPTATKAQIQAAQQEAKDTKAGVQQLNTELKDVHSGSMKQLQTDLNRTHNAQLGQLVHTLENDGSASNMKLADDLIKVHTQAMDKLVKDEEVALKAAVDAKLTSKLDQQAKLVADQAKQTSDRIADSTKVYLDQQAQAGLTGAALTAAQAQTSMDEVTAASNQAIDADSTKVDQSSGASALIQAQVAEALAQAQATAQIQEAQAQSVLDKANAAANVASAAASTTPTADTTAAAATPAAVTNNFQIFGNGSLTAADLFREVGWALTTGALPVAAPAPQPAAAAA